MSQIFFILLINLFFLYNYVDNTEDKYNEIDWKAINDWTKLGVSLVNLQHTKDLKAIVDVMSVLGIIVPCLGPVSTILSGLLDIYGEQPNEFQEIKNKLNEMDDHLFAIENKIDSLFDAIFETGTINYYKERALMIDIIEDAYSRFVNTPTNITRKQLIIDCNNKRMLEYINYVNRELSSNELMPLMSLMKDKYDMNKFQFWSKMLVTSLSQAMFLHTVCMSLEHSDSTELNITMQADIDHFIIVSNTLTRVTEDGIRDIENNFFKMAAIKEIEDYAEENKEEAHDSFANNLFAILKEKYFWRYWFVGSYSDETLTDEEHDVDGGPWVYYWFREKGRCLYISSTNNATNFTPDLENCINSRENEMVRDLNANYNTICKRIKNTIGNCLGWNFNGIGVIQHNNDFRAKHHDNQTPFINVKLTYYYEIDLVVYSFTDSSLIREFSIFVIGPELK